MQDTAVDIVFHAIEAGAVVLGGLWHVVRLEVKLAVLAAKVDLLIRHTGLGAHRQGD